MTWHVSEDVEQFLAAAGDLLLHEPGVHTILLTNCENARAGVPGSTFAWWQEPDGDITGAVSWKPPYPLFLGPLSDSAVSGLPALLPFPAVAGPSALAVQVAAVTAQARGTSVTLKHAERLFRLGTLLPPEVPGKARTAGPSDAPLLVGWSQEFVRETGVVGGDEEQSVADRLSYGGMVLWEVDGLPVAMAGRSRVAFGSGRIGPVYTPPEHRGRGYGAAVTAAASQDVLDQGGWEVVLFTDLTNPTSNALYARLGYAPVHDVTVLDVSR